MAAARQTLASNCDEDAIGSVYRVQDLRAYLTGRWIVHRRMKDMHAACNGHFDGEATCLPQGAHLRYSERGSCRLGDYVGRGARRYLFSFPEAAIAEVYFEDGRHFHRLDMMSGQCQVSHYCPPDLYHGAFRALSETCWTSTWCVNGPSKQQIIETRYARRTLSHDHARL